MNEYNEHIVGILGTERYQPQRVIHYRLAHSNSDCRVYIVCLTMRVN